MSDKEFPACSCPPEKQGEATCPEECCNCMWGKIAMKNRPSSSRIQSLEEEK